MMNLLSTTSPYSTDDRRLLYVFYYCLSAVIEGLLDNKGSAWRGNPMIIFTMISSSDNRLSAINKRDSEGSGQTYSINLWFSQDECR